MAKIRATEAIARRFGHVTLQWRLYIVRYGEFTDRAGELFRDLASTIDRLASTIDRLASTIAIVGELSTDSRRLPPLSRTIN